MLAKSDQAEYPGSLVFPILDHSRISVRALTPSQDHDPVAFREGIKILAVLKWRHQHGVKNCVPDMTAFSSSLKITSEGSDIGVSQVGLMGDPAKGIPRFVHAGSPRCDVRKPTSESVTVCPTCPETRP